ncbi:zona pellucida sperm-binding protein 4-like isoform X2 [Ornithorhynchus anatinus]|uniref:Zona pellucida sperm-binding protein 4 n=1 Tax=Ornithorhynchus anatinus TaxID=9258 RepID=F6Q8L3_ORNAN|nr:zona pellucida sperm-binding protein 4-like isoform X2 [Ornithorhynchus anatinus]
MVVGLWVRLCWWLLAGPLVLAGPSLLTCGETSLQFTLLLGAGNQRPHVSVMTVDAKGVAHELQNDSTCGTSLLWKPDGSVVVGVAYGSCYINQKNGSHVMTIWIATPALPGNGSLSEEIRCPAHLAAQDAPAASPCATVQLLDRVSCVPGVSPLLTQEDCETRGCCYDPTDQVIPCYYSNQVTVHCTASGQFSIMISKEVTLPPLVLDSVHLSGNQTPECAPMVQNQAFTLFRFPFSSCGTTFQESRGQRVYENTLVAEQAVQTSQAASITRDSVFRATVRCSYAAGDSLPVSFWVSTMSPPAPATQQGPLALELRIATDIHYSSYYNISDYPVVRLLRDPVHVEVRLLKRTDPNLVLVLHHCWATPSTNLQQEPMWPILEDGCPYAKDSYATQLVPISAKSALEFPSHYQRFAVSAFTFMDSTSQQALHGPIYFHCSASACLPQGLEPCTSPCTRSQVPRLRRTSYHSSAEPLTLVTAKGPVDFTSNQRAQTPGLQEGIQAARSQIWWTKVAVAGAAVLLTALILLAVGIRMYWQQQNCASVTI